MPAGSSLGWTNILNRLTDRNIINLGFSGNGRLEKPVVDLITEIDASVFVLDCLPNLVSRKDYPAEELKKLILNAVAARCSINIRIRPYYWQNIL